VVGPRHVYCEIDPGQWLGEGSVFVWIFLRTEECVWSFALVAGIGSCLLGEDHLRPRDSSISHSRCGKGLVNPIGDVNMTCVLIVVSFLHQYLSAF
jgi:hypothetical protein